MNPRPGRGGNPDAGAPGPSARISVAANPAVGGRLGITIRGSRVVYVVSADGVSIVSGAGAPQRVHRSAPARALSTTAASAATIQLAKDRRGGGDSGGGSRPTPPEGARPRQRRLRRSERQQLFPHRAHRRKPCRRIAARRPVDDALQAFRQVGAELAGGGPLAVQDVAEDLRDRRRPGTAGGRSRIRRG